MRPRWLERQSTLAFSSMFVPCTFLDEKKPLNLSHNPFFEQTRKPTSVRIMALSSAEDYEILNVLEFSSTRKRMSVICRNPQGKLKLLCKGADSVIFERLAPKQLFLEKTTAHLDEFALEGLRTLCIAVAELDEVFYEEWQKKFQAASVTLVNRAEAVRAPFLEFSSQFA